MKNQNVTHRSLFQAGLLQTAQTLLLSIDESYTKNVGINDLLYFLKKGAKVPASAYDIYLIY